MFRDRRPDAVRTSRSVGPRRREPDVRGARGASPVSDKPLCLIVAHAPLSANILLSSFSERVHVSRDDTGPTPGRIRALVDFVEDELEGAEGLLEAEGVLQRLAELILVILVRHLVNASASIQAVLPTALVDPHVRPSGILAQPTMVS